MARYFFHLDECSIATLDDTGLERDTIDEVRKEACAAAREVMCAEIQEGRLCLACYIEVKDETGASVLTVPLREAVKITGL